MFGYFQNAGDTRRQGFEAKLSYKMDRLNAYANYTYVDATYRSPLTISSPNNPDADANGNIFVVPGDRIPAIPLYRFKVGGDPFLLEALLRRAGPGCSADCGLLHRIHGGDHLLGAIRQPVHPPGNPRRVDHRIDLWQIGGRADAVAGHHQ